MATPGLADDRPSFTDFLKKTKEKGSTCEGSECATPQRRGRKSKSRASEGEGVSSQCKY